MEREVRQRLGLLSVGCRASNGPTRKPYMLRLFPLLSRIGQWDWERWAAVRDRVSDLVGDRLSDRPGPAHGGRWPAEFTPQLRRGERLRPALAAFLFGLGGASCSGSAGRSPRTAPPLPHPDDRLPACQSPASAGAAVARSNRLDLCRRRSPVSKGSSKMDQGACEPTGLYRSGASLVMTELSPSARLSERQFSRSV